MPTTVSFALPAPEFEQHTWEHEGEHNPGSHPPLTLEIPGMEGGIAPDGLPYTLKLNGYSYNRLGAPGLPFDVRSLPRAPQATALDRWRDFWLPRVDAVREELRNFDPRSVTPGRWQETLEDVGARFGQVFAGVHVSAVIRAGMVAHEFIAEYARLFGQEREPDGRALLHGFGNETSRRAQAIWEAGRLVSANPSLRTEVGRWQPGQPLPATAGFADALERLLERWGETIDRHLQDLPSWQENPAPVVAMVLASAAQDEARSPAAAEARAAERRQHLESELRARAAADPAFEPLVASLPVAQQMVVVSEDHNVLCDQRLTAASRVRWLAVGRFLVDLGRLTAADDVFYCSPPELLAALEGGAPPPPATLRERRVLQAAYRAATPPKRLGAGARTVAERPGGTVLRGAAAAPGRYEGVARVARSLEDAARLEPGEVLVCTVTAPSWTPFFAIAGAVVTEAGGELSHAAVVAREFGIPAVTGTGTATRDIAPGVRLAVDGTAGIVEIVD